MITVRQASAVVAAAALFLVMAVSFVGLPWPQTQHVIPIYNNTTTNGTATGLSNSLFGPYAVTIVLIAIILGAAMIGGVYLAKMDQGGKIGP